MEGQYTLLKHPTCLSLVLATQDRSISFALNIKTNGFSCASPDILNWKNEVGIAWFGSKCFNCVAACTSLKLPVRTVYTLQARLPVAQQAQKLTDGWYVCSPGKPSDWVEDPNLSMHWRFVNVVLPSVSCPVRVFHDFVMSEQS